MPKLYAHTPESLGLIADLLRAGGLAALPTETVYGLAGRADRPDTIARLFALKGRPSFNPLIAHVTGRDMAGGIADLNDPARFLMDMFWPGPLTLVLRCTDTARVCDLARAGLPSVAVRMPRHDATLAIIDQVGQALAMPSANRSGHVSPTTPAHVIDDLGDGVDAVLAGGLARVGIESTVLDVTGAVPVILREGGISAETLADALGEQPIRADASQPDRPASPGMLMRHYAPRARLRLRAVDVDGGEALLAFGSTRFMGVRGGGAVSDWGPDRLLNLSPDGDLEEAAANLYRHLRALDAAGHHAIAVMDIPDRGLGRAINDRLRRAAAV